MFKQKVKVGFGLFQISTTLPPKAQDQATQHQGLMQTSHERVPPTQPQPLVSLKQ